MLLAACQISQVPAADDEPSSPAPAPGSDRDGGETDGQGGAGGTVAAGRQVSVEPRELNVREGGTGRYRVALSERPEEPVTVTVTVPEGTSGITVSPDRLEFAPAHWESARTVTVSAARDADAVAARPVDVSHAVTGYGDAVVPSVRVTVVEVDAQTLAMASARGSEGAGALYFEVFVSVAGGIATVEYETGGDGETGGADATEGQDYTGSTGTLKFPAASTATQTIAIELLDDAIDEPDEYLTVTLKNANVALAGGADTLAATGAIEDDDPLPVLSIGDSTVDEGTATAAIGFPVRLEPASGFPVTVGHATADGTATAAEDYTGASGTLTILAGSTAQTIWVPVLDDEVYEDDSETFSVTLAGAQYAELSADATVATGTITDDDAPVLASLQIVPADRMYPAFAPDIQHYAMTCKQSTELRVTASAPGSGMKLTLLRANVDDNHTSVGSLDTTVTVNRFHDVVVELSGSGDRHRRYIVHCIPPDFATIKILKRLDSASDGLMFTSPRGGNVAGYGAVIDYNGVPRFVMTSGYHLRPLAYGPTLAGTQARYATASQLFDVNFQSLGRMHTVSPIESINSHDIWVTNTSWLLIAYQDTTRDLSDFEDEHGTPLSTSATVTDSVIQEVSVAGAQRFLWNSWDHLVLEEDCLLVEKLARDHTEYAHLNSLQVVDGDIIASFRGCAQVLRIDRSAGSGAVEWKLGGSTGTRDSDTVHLPLVNDPAAEFCGQHHATLTESDTVLMFDNGVQCLGPRKDRAPFSRVVEYDISSGTMARFKRQYVRPSDQGYAKARGGVTLFEHDGQERWLVTWGGELVDVSSSLTASQVVAISELDPAILDRDPTADPTVFAMSLYKKNKLVRTYRVYHMAQDDFVLPLRLP